MIYLHKCIKNNTMGNKSLAEYTKCDSGFSKCMSFEDIMTILRTEHFSKNVCHEYYKFYRNKKKSDFDIDKSALEYLKNIKCDDNLFKPFDQLEYDIFRLYKYDILKTKSFAHSENILLIKRTILYFLKDAQIFEKFIDEMEIYYGRTFPTVILSLLADLQNAEKKELYHTDKYVYI